MAASLAGRFYELAHDMAPEVGTNVTVNNIVDETKENQKILPQLPLDINLNIHVYIHNESTDSSKDMIEIK